MLSNLIDLYIEPEILWEIYKKFEYDWKKFQIFK